MVKSLDDLMELSTTPAEDKRVSIKDILDTLFSSEAMEQKSFLFDVHVQAIMRMNAANMFLEETYGFRIQMYDLLILDKLHYVISIGARGRNDILHLVESMRDQMIVDSGGQVPTGRWSRP